MGAEAILEKPIKREELLEIAKTSLVALDELWQRPADAAPDTHLKTSFSSLAEALRQKRIGFGRRGFCIKLPYALREGALQFTLKFRDEDIVLSGRGVVRWLAPEEDVAGIEIICLDQPGCNWMIAQVNRNHPLPFIPSSPGLEHRLQSKVA
jgi:hypothetical protein